MSGTPFIIFALPRSRTYWLSQFLSYGGWECYHDRAAWMRSLGDVDNWFSQNYTGTVETAAAPFWRHILRIRPDIRVVTVRRSVEECVKSWMAVQPNSKEEAIRAQFYKLDAKLNQIEARVTNCLRVETSEPDFEKKIFTHCLECTVDENWLSAKKTQNLQINTDAQIRYVRASFSALQKLSAQMSQHERLAMAEKIPQSASLTFQQESFDVVWRDAEKLFQSHMVKTDQSVDGYLKKNLPLLKNLYNLGFLKLTTARCNGRMVGYLLTILAPSLDAVGEKNAEHTTFFCDPAFPGAGLKLMRAAEQALVNDGATNFLARAGVRGDGARLGVLYKRLGYEEFGSMYRKGCV